MLPLSHVRLDLRRLPSRYYGGTNLWLTFSEARKINRQTSQYSYAAAHTPRLDFLHELAGTNSRPAVRHSRRTKLSVTFEKRQGARTTVDPRSSSAFGNLREISVTFLERTTRHDTTWHKLGAEQGTAGPLLLEQIDRTRSAYLRSQLT